MPVGLLTGLITGVKGVAPVQLPMAVYLGWLPGAAAAVAVLEHHTDHAVPAAVQVGTQTA